MNQNAPIGYWTGGDIRPEPYEEIISSAIQHVAQPVYLVKNKHRICMALHGQASFGSVAPQNSTVGAKNRHALVAVVPPLHPDALGDPYFKSTLGLRYAYVVGAMANGITSVDMVEAAGKAGMIGFFGAAGLDLSRIEKAIEQLKQRMGGRPYGFNLIHSPSDPDLEFKTVCTYLERGINLVSASAYMDLTPALVYYRIKGIHRDSDGKVVCPNKVVGKISREEVARKFFSPPSEKILTGLLEKGLLSQSEAELSQHVPVAEMLTAEADSGGHTDNRPALTLLPTILALRNQMVDMHRYKMPLCVGLGGGIATPDAAAAAFSMGAAYVLTGSVNQACVEAGTSPTVRKLLAEAGQADVAMAPAADMFEMGVKVQVLKRGTMFPLRAAKLYDLYSRYPGYESIPQKDRILLERDFFRGSFSEEWNQTRAFFEIRDPSQISKAESDPRHKMALVFRSYLGRSSNWANTGEPSRRMDYQIWCGPSIGAFNAWVKDTFLEQPDNRSIAVVAMNLMLGAAALMRFTQLKNQGISLPANAFRYVPMPLADIEKLLL
ncbi:MAG: PfaD family polyunsaturated fatty acid/polyketide biosynthesis protein [Deltaproteobacteria bacterium]|nr:PfaD family polyunsaturated fatty acid/polyketide biosynthesis protein [Deltaproteobacteria bacterium]